MRCSSPRQPALGGRDHLKLHAIADRAARASHRLMRDGVAWGGGAPPPELRFAARARSWRCGSAAARRSEHRVRKMNLALDGRKLGLGGGEAAALRPRGARRLPRPRQGRGEDEVLSLPSRRTGWSRRVRKRRGRGRRRAGGRPGGAIRGSVEGREEVMAMATEEIAPRVRSRSQGAGSPRSAPPARVLGRTSGYARDGPRVRKLARAEPAAGPPGREISEGSGAVARLAGVRDDSRRSQPFAGAAPRWRRSGMRHEFDRHAGARPRLRARVRPPAPLESRAAPEEGTAR